MNTQIANNNPNINGVAAPAAAPAQPSPAIPLNDVVQAYIAAKALVIRLATLNCMRCHLGKLTKLAGTVPISAVTTAQIEQAVHAPNLMPGSRKQVLNDVKALFTWARNNGYLPPCVRTAADSLQIRVPQTQPQIVAPGDLQTLLRSTTDVGILLYLVLLAFTGIRARELLRLAWEDISPDGHIMLNQRITGVGARIIPILSVLGSWLAPFVGCQGRLFPSLYAAEKFQRWSRTKNFPSLGRMLRHSFCTYRVAATGNLAEVACEAGISPTLVNHHFVLPATTADAEKYFSLAPAAAGIVNWDKAVKAYLARQCNSGLPKAA